MIGQEDMREKRLEWRVKITPKCKDKKIRKNKTNGKRIKSRMKRNRII